MIIGTKMLMADDVSSMITTREYVMRQYAESMAPTARMIGTIWKLYVSESASISKIFS